MKASGFVITEVYSGTAKGIDEAGEAWAKTQGIPVRRFPANWELYGKAAGHVRNREMIAAEAEGLIAIWDGLSRGTEDCISQARLKKLKVFVYRVSDAA